MSTRPPGSKPRENLSPTPASPGPMDPRQLAAMIEEPSPMPAPRPEPSLSGGSDPDGPAVDIDLDPRRLARLIEGARP
jgi:hypothetical protein